MAKFVKGEVVVIPFPFSDLTQAKRRPALVVAPLEGDDVICCQITSQNIRDRYAIPLNDSDFQRGQLKQSSNIRPNRLFTADSSIILQSVGKIRIEKLKEVIEKIVLILQEG